jgi:hypothetical protein
MTARPLTCEEVERVRDLVGRMDHPCGPDALAVYLPNIVASLDVLLEQDNYVEALRQIRRADEAEQKLAQARDYIRQQCGMEGYGECPKNMPTKAAWCRHCRALERLS